ncbi:MAG: hypothetical protein BAJALOKI1v1_440020 [Promethearchaeota archaeon]|nr:MAG: hypothetical protein BAJALOKI1v1_440020 [Candidatus Lokiarchaeota archaeon]
MQETRTFLETNEDKSFILYLLKNTPIEGNTKFVKLIFLANYFAKKSNQLIPFHYNFFRYKYGPYSKGIQNDINNLKLSGLIKTIENNTYILTEKGKEVSSKLEEHLPEEKKKIIHNVLDNFSNKDTQWILNFVYDLDEFKNTSCGEKINLG